MNLTCSCGHSDSIFKFIVDTQHTTKEKFLNNKPIIQEFTVTTYKCPSCKTETKSENGGSWEFKNPEDNEDIFECQICGEVISEETHDEYDGCCQNCYEKQSEEEENEK